MQKILCATRGGEASYSTQDAAIALAQSRGDVLIFVYVVDIEFLRKAEYSVRPDIVTKEMANMGGFLLAMAQERAANQGVEAQARIYHGQLVEELITAIKTEQAGMLILGRPAGDSSAFESPALQSLAKEIEQETGVEVRIV